MPSRHLCNRCWWWFERCALKQPNQMPFRERRKKPCGDYVCTSRKKKLGPITSTQKICNVYALSWPTDFNVSVKFSFAHAILRVCIKKVFFCDVNRVDDEDLEHVNCKKKSIDKVSELLRKLLHNKRDSRDAWKCRI